MQRWVLSNFQWVVSPIGPSDDRPIDFRTNDIKDTCLHAFPWNDTPQKTYGFLHVAETYSRGVFTVNVNSTSLKYTLARGKVGSILVGWRLAGVSSFAVAASQLVFAGWCSHFPDKSEDTDVVILFEQFLILLITYFKAMSTCTNLKKN